MSAGGLFSSSSAFFSSPEFLALEGSDLLPVDSPDFDQVNLPSFADLRSSFIFSLLTSLVNSTLPLSHHVQIMRMKASNRKSGLGGLYTPSNIYI